MKTIKINNEPEYAKHYEFVVVRNTDDQLWFYGAYSDGFKADEVAYKIGGLVVHNIRIQGYQP